MRRFFGFLYWCGLAIGLLVLVLLLADQAVIELLIGLIAAKRRFLLFAGLTSLLLVIAGLFGRRILKLPPSRLRILGAVLAGFVFFLALLSARTTFTESDFRFQSEGAALAGTLYSPAVSEQAPCVVIVHGSAPFPRSFYDAYARRLADEGFAVLLADKRGAGESGGEFESNNNAGIKNLTLLAKDVSNAVDVASLQPVVDASRIYLLGISQGGWVGPMAATMNEKVAGIVVITGPSVSVREEGIWSELRGDDEEEAQVGFADAERRIQATDPGGFDPRPVLASLDIPMLWLFGDHDNSIPSRKSMQVLAQFREQHDKPFDFRSYPGHGHLLIGKGQGALIPDVNEQSWQDIIGWLRKDHSIQTGRP